MLTQDRRWWSAKILCEYLLHVLGSEPHRLDGKEVLELGAGTGLVGLILGIAVPACRVTITDQQCVWWICVVAECRVALLRSLTTLPSFAGSSCR